MILVYHKIFSKSRRKKRKIFRGRGKREGEKKRKEKGVNYRNPKIKIDFKRVWTSAISTR